MSLFTRSLMTPNEINDRASRFYKPERRSPKTNTIIVVIFCGLFAGAFCYSLTSTLDQQQRLHCQQGWQPACEALK
jgi:H+/Cl- antiporter ClcA